MAAIYPFRALRPAPAAAAAVSSVPYDVVSTEEARQLAAGNPLSFLHVTRSEIDLPPGTDPYATAVYDRARENFRKLRKQAPLVVDDVPALYFYRLRMGEHEQIGVAGCFSIDEYEQDAIKKHERTRRDKEDDRTRHIVELRAQTGIVLLTYRASADVDAEAKRVTAGHPLYDFTSPDGIQHSVWRAESEQARALAAAFAQIPALYIADGHHRAASAARARAALPTAVGGSEGKDAEAFVAVAFPDNQVQILPYNRTVKDLAGLSAEALLRAISERFPVQDGAPTPRRKGEVCLFLAGRWHAVDLSAASPADETRASGLDVAQLQHHILGPLLKIGDIRTDRRIDFVGGARGTQSLEQAVSSGKAAAAFSMYPVTVDDLIGIADVGGIMPPKSTWFEPKLRDGLLVHLI